MTQQARINAFLDGSRFAVVGASRDRSKYGNKVLRAYLQHKRDALPINPYSERIEGQRAYPDLKSLPHPVDGISIVTPPDVTEQIVEQAVEQGIQHLWMQPGAESEQAIRDAEQAGMNVISGGPCLLVVLGYRE